MGALVAQLAEGDALTRDRFSIRLLGPRLVPTPM